MALLIVWSELSGGSELADDGSAFRNGRIWANPEPFFSCIRLTRIANTPYRETDPMNAHDDRDSNGSNFPLAESGRGHPEIPEPFFEGPRGTIYLVGCSSEELPSLCDLLNAAGLAVRAFSNPFEAVEAIGRSHPGIIIADVHMPEMNGLELLGRVMDVSPNTRVILSSSDPNWPAYSEVLERGAEALIDKPIPTSALLKLIGAILRNA